MIYWSKPFIQEYNAETRGDKFFVRDEDSLLHQELKGYMILQLPFIIQKMIEHLSRRPLESTCECIMDTLLA